MINNFPRINDLSAIAEGFQLTGDSASMYLKDLYSANDLRELEELRYCVSSRLEDRKIELKRPENVNTSLQPCSFNLSSIVLLESLEV